MVRIGSSLLALLGLALAIASPAQVRAPAQTAGGTETGALVGATSAAPARESNNLARQAGSLLQDQRSGRRAPPFGSELFQQAPPPPGGPILDPSYIMRPGDTVSVTQWGLVNSSAQVVVDPEGNIVVPGLGPVKVGGLEAGRVNDKVGSAARETYRSTVQTYAAPLSATSLQVFVTGPVLRPGVHTGSSTDSIVSFLQRAGGPDSDRGSYRHIAVRRDGKIIANADLYAFLVEGRLPDIRLRQGDVIVVGQQGSVVTVSGDARAPFTFELANSTGVGAEVLRYSRPRPEVTDITMLAIRNAQPVNVALPLDRFGSEPLSDGDRIRFEANARADTYVVQVVGAVDGARSFVVPRGTRLGTVLSQLTLDPLADRAMIHLRRSSVALAQKQLLDDSLARLEKAVYTTPTSSTTAQARQVDAAGLEQYIARARTVQPEGLVSLRGIDANQIIIEPDDVIVVPFLNQAVTVSGEVGLPQSLIASEQRDVSAYIKQAGGFTERANRSQVLVISPDGSARVGGGVNPGDRILVPPKISTATFDLIRDVSTILYQLGVAAAAVLN